MNLISQDVLFKTFFVHSLKTVSKSCLSDVYDIFNDKVGKKKYIEW